MCVLPGNSTVRRGAPRLVASAPKCSQACCLRSRVLPGFSPVRSGTPRLITRVPRCSQISHQRPQVLLGAPGGHCKGPINSEIVNCRIMLRLLSDTLRVSRRLNYILLMNGKPLSSRTADYINLNGTLLVYGMLQRYINSLWTICWDLYVG